MYPERLYAERALRAGAMAYVNKASETLEIIKAIRAVVAGHVYLSAEMSGQLLGRMVGASQQAARQTPIDALSDRELEVFKHLGEGLPTASIARKMHISPKTVDAFRTRIKAKLGVSNSSELMQQAVQWVMQNP